MVIFVSVLMKLLGKMMMVNIKLMRQFVAQ
nr:MAG TPA: PTS system, IIB component, TRANSPORT PROTEIN.5A [Caudoviricetes sp.]